MAAFLEERNFFSILEKSDRLSYPNSKLAIFILWAFTVWFWFCFFSCRRKYVRLISSNLAAFKSLQASWNEVVDNGKKLNSNSSVGERKRFCSKNNSLSLSLIRLLISILNSHVATEPHEYFSNSRSHESQAYFFPQEVCCAQMNGYPSLFPVKPFCLYSWILSLLSDFKR